MDQMKIKWLCMSHISGDIFPEKDTRRKRYTGYHICQSARADYPSQALTSASKETINSTYTQVWSLAFYLFLLWFSIGFYINNNIYLEVMFWNLSYVIDQYLVYLHQVNLGLFHSN